MADELEGDRDVVVSGARGGGGGVFVSAPEGSASAFVSRLAAYLSEGAFEEATTRWLAERAAELVAACDAAKDGEHPLECHAAYKEFLELVEELLAGFLKAEGVSAEQFQAAVRAAEGSDDAASGFVAALVASWEFESFVTLLRDTLRGDVDDGGDPEPDDDVDDDEDERPAGPPIED